MSFQATITANLTNAPTRTLIQINRLKRLAYGLGAAEVRVIPLRPPSLIRLILVPGTNQLVVR